MEWKEFTEKGDWGRVRSYWTYEINGGVFIEIAQHDDKFHLTVYDAERYSGYGQHCALAESSHKSFWLAKKNVPTLLMKIYNRYSKALEEFKKDRI